MKNQINTIAKTALFAVAITLLLGTQSCKKDESTTVTPTPTPTFSIVGTWALESAKVTIDGKDLTISRADITKGGFFQPSGLETTFTADGKYTRGSETGNYVLSIGQLKLGTTSYNSFTSPDLTTFVYGNKWEGNTDAALQNEVFFVSQKILDNVQVTVPSSSKSVTYLFTYKKK